MSIEAKKLENNKSAYGVRVTEKMKLGFVTINKKKWAGRKLLNGRSEESPGLSQSQARLLMNILERGSPLRVKSYEVLVLPRANWVLKDSSLGALCFLLAEDEFRNSPPEDVRKRDV